MSELASGFRAIAPEQVSATCPVRCVGGPHEALDVRPRLLEGPSQGDSFDVLLHGSLVLKDGFWYVHGAAILIAWLFI